MSEKEYYQICLHCNFSSYEINQYCLETKIDFKTLKEETIFYLKNILNKSILDLNNQEINFLFGIKKLNLINQFRKLIITMLETINQEYLWSDPLGCICLYLFDYFKSVNFDSESIDKKLKEHDLDFHKTVELVARYILNNSRYKEDLVKDYFSHLVSKSLDSTNTLLKKILQENNQDVINSLLDNSIQNYNYVKTQIHDFIVQDYEDAYDQVKANLELKFNNYYQYKLNKKRVKSELERLNTKKDNLDLANSIIKAYIESSFRSKDDYCNFFKLTLKQFDYYLSIVKEYNHDLYTLYNKKKEMIAKQNYTILMNLVEKIIDGIRNGINLNDKTRPFDLMDYYTITSLERSKVLKLIKENCCESDYRLFLNFLRKYSDSRLLKEKDLEKLLKEKYTFNNREITYDEKIFIINYLNSNHIPLYDTIYYIAIKRYLNEELVLEDNSFIKRSR